MGSPSPPWFMDDPLIFRYRKTAAFDESASIVMQKLGAISLVSDHVYEDSDDLIGLATMLSASAPDPIFSIIDLIPIFLRYASTTKLVLGWRRHEGAASMIFDAFHYLCRTEYPYVVRVLCLDMDDFLARMIPQDRIAVRVCDDAVVSIHCKDQRDAVMVKLHWQVPAGTELSMEV